MSFFPISQHWYLLGGSGEGQWANTRMKYIVRKGLEDNTMKYCGALALTTGTNLIQNRFGNRTKAGSSDLNQATGVLHCGLDLTVPRTIECTV